MKMEMRMEMLYSETHTR